ncbi:MAG: hypothetical protein KJO57_09450 [Deltaproteobacteria bacterium]|nr:hypothetical protein [Deltaproteobacteria bacterium]
MVYAMVPGASEIVENVSHLLVEGHAAHELADADHEPQGEEHGCSGTFHMCHCHTSVTFLTGTTAPEVASAPEHRQTVSWDVDDARADGCTADMFRPPSA